MSSGARNVHEEIDNFLSILGPGDQMARENSQTVGQKERYEKCEGTMEMEVKVIQIQGAIYYFGYFLILCIL